MIEETNHPDMTVISGQYKKERDYWLNRLSGELQKSSFPYDFIEMKKPGELEKTKGCVKFSLSYELSAKILKLSNKSDFRLHMILTAALVFLLNRYTGNTDIIVGAPVIKQDIDVKFINTMLILRNRVHGRMSFRELLLQVRQTIIEATEYVNYPMKMLLYHLDLAFNDDGFPLFDVVILLENIHDPKYIRDIRPGVIFSFLRKEETLEGKMEYSTLLYKKSTIERMSDYFTRVLEHALFNIDLSMGDIDLLPEEDKKRLLIDFNNTEMEYPGEKAVHLLFEEQVEKTPGYPAVVHEDSQLTYRQLNDEADRLAAFLSEQGVKPGSIIGLLTDRSIMEVCAVLAVLKCGCAYLPLDREYPTERQLYMLEDSAAVLLLAQEKLAVDLNWKGRTILAEDIEKDQTGTPAREKIAVKPSDPAYVIYTSGSTGKPKGVVIRHRSVVNYTWWAAKQYVKGEKVNFPLYSPLAFDLTVTSIFTPLITGNTIFIYRWDDREFLIDRIIRENKVGVVKLTPVHLMLIQSGRGFTGENPSNIKRFIVGGEKLEIHLARKIDESFNGDIEIYNEYGPTEATVGCMIYKFDPATDNSLSVPIGIPGGNVGIYLWDEGQRCVPPGLVGELYIAGQGLAAGYLNRPELTAEKFLSVSNRSYRSYRSYNPGKIYKTGDLARRLEDGNIEFIGRKDHQVKIRGYRVEVGEIESRLLKHDRIEEAVVLAKDDEKGYKYLAAYVVPAALPLEAGELRQYLLKYLPDFMLPSYFVQLEKLPVTTNGKVDRRALPEPDKHALKSGAEYRAPRTRQEKIMAAIWQDVMGVEQVGIDDDYFELGGDSIKALQIASRLQEYKLKVEIRYIFQYTTIGRISPFVESMEQIAPQDAVEGEVPLTPIQYWFFEKAGPGKHHFNQSVMLKRDRGFKEEFLEEVFARLTEHHDALRLVFAFAGEEKQVKQVNGNKDAFQVDISVYDLTGETFYEKVIEEKCNQIQVSMDLSKGPLLKLGLFRTADCDYLLIVVHHLVIDGVSWRILLEDFSTLYKQRENRESMVLPLKTTSYKEWAEKLRVYAHSSTLLEELDYWAQLEETGLEVGGGKNRENSVGNTRKLSFRLSPGNTEKLLKEVNRAYNTEINDILLSALALALHRWTGAERVLVGLEGHGRENIIADVNVTRTIGWFTSLYPVVLDMANAEDIGALIKNTRGMLRRVPNKGIGCGILKYLTPKEKKQGVELNLQPRIGFNYLGQFEGSRETDQFEFTSISTGTSISPDFQREYWLEIIGMVSGGKLAMTVSYDSAQYDENSIAAFRDFFKQGLEQIIDHCAEPKESQLTLADLSSEDVNEEELSSIYDELEEAFSG